MGSKGSSESFFVADTPSIVPILDYESHSPYSESESSHLELEWNFLLLSVATTSFGDYFDMNESQVRAILLESFRVLEMISFVIYLGELHLNHPLWNSTVIHI